MWYFRKKDFEIFVKCANFAENDMIMTKAELRATLLNEINAFLDDDVMMERAIYALRALRNDSLGCEVLSEPPCQYSVEEVNKRIDRNRKDIEQGKYYTHEEVKKKYGL